MRRLILIITILLSFTAITRSQVIAVNTDLLMDGAMLPNIGAEYVTGNSTSVSLNVIGASKPWGIDLKMIAIQPEFRYYFSRRAMYHHYVGVCTPIGSYKLDDGAKIYDGYGIGIGVTFGYVIKLSNHWNIDLHAGVQNFFYQQKEYWEGDRYDEMWRDSSGRLYHNAKGAHFLPTRVGVSFAYIIK